MGGPLEWKTPRAERQLSGSEETGDINPSLSLQLCPSHRLSLSLRILGLCEGHVAFGGEKGRRAWDLGSSADKGEPHTSMKVIEEHRTGKDHALPPLLGPREPAPSSTDTEVPKLKPNFIYIHPKAHDLGLEDRSQGRGG